MIARLSTRISSYFISKYIISAELQEEYSYGLELMLATLINFMVIILIGAATQMLLHALVYAIVFSTLRKTAGGYHASKHWQCVLILAINLTILLALIMHTRIQEIAIVNFAILSVAILSILLLPTIDNKENPLSKRQKKNLKNKNNVYLLMFVIVCFVLFFNSIYNYSFIIVYCIFTVALSKVAGYIKNIQGAKTHEKK